MRMIAIMIVACCLVTSCTKENVQQSQEGDTNNPAAATKYSFALVSVEPGPWGRFEFRHEYDKPIELLGFGFAETNVFRVRSPLFEREEDGQWDKVKVGYCGTGNKMYPLEPDRDYVLLVELWPFLKKGQRGIVELHADGTNITLRSEPFDTAGVRKIGRGGPSRHTWTEDTAPSPAGCDRYVVKQGDTLSRIARRFRDRDSLNEIVTRNHLKNVNQIRAGDVLWIKRASGKD